MKELNIGGIFFAPIVADLFFASLIYLVVRRLALRSEGEQRIWHPPLFNLCVFIIILSLLVLLHQNLW